MQAHHFLTWLSALRPTLAWLLQPQDCAGWIYRSLLYRVQKGLDLGCPIAHKWQQIFVRLKQEGRGSKSNEWFATKGWDSCSHGRRQALCCLKKGITNNNDFFIGSVGHDIWWEYMFSGNRTVAGRSLSILSTHLVNTLKSQGSSPWLLAQSFKNKLAKARKMRKPAGTLGISLFGPGKLWFKKVWAQNMCIDFLAELDHSE